MVRAPFLDAFAQGEASRLAPVLRPLIRVVVADAQVLLRDMHRSLQRDEMTALQVAAVTGFLRVCATEEVKREVEEHVREFAANTRVDPERLGALWREVYVPCIRFVDVADLPDAPASAQLAARDPSDLPTVRLSVLLRGAPLLSADADLIDTGFAPDEWLPFALAGRALGTAGSLGILTVQLGTLVGALSVEAAQKAISAPGRAGLLAAGAAAAGFLAIRYVGTARVKQQASDAAREARNVVRLITAQAAEGAELLRSGLHPNSPQTALLEAMAYLLAVSVVPLSPTEIAAALGDGTWSPDIDAVDRLLRTHRCFVMATPDGWQLGPRPV